MEVNCTEPSLSVRVLWSVYLPIHQFVCRPTVHLSVCLYEQFFSFLRQNFAAGTTFSIIENENEMRSSDHPETSQKNLWPVL